MVVHHQSYVSNYNKALEQLNDAIYRADPSTVVKLQSAIKFNGGGPRPLIVVYPSLFVLAHVLHVLVWFAVDFKILVLVQNFWSWNLQVTSTTRSSGKIWLLSAWVHLTSDHSKCLHLDDFGNVSIGSIITGRGRWAPKRFSRWGYWYTVRLFGVLAAEDEQGRCSSGGFGMGGKPSAMDSSFGLLLPFGQHRFISPWIGVYSGLVSTRSWSDLSLKPLLIRSIACNFNPSYEWDFVVQKFPSWIIALYFAPQDPLIAKGHSLVPLIGLDVWEHAYYLQVHCPSILNLKCCCHHCAVLSIDFYFDNFDKLVRKWSE